MVVAIARKVLPARSRMPVFVSYYRADELAARNAYNRLLARDVPAYIDVMDPELQGVENVTTRILDRLGSCTHVLAVLSRSTVLSWWVPFEIGVATHADGRIASYDTAGGPRTSLPDYLRNWPILLSLADVDAFAQRYKQDRRPLEKAYRLNEARVARIQSASEFHRVLKSDIGQG
jgi:hypothetical protein